MGGLGARVGLGLVPLLWMQLCACLLLGAHVWGNAAAQDVVDTPEEGDVDEDAVHGEVWVVDTMSHVHRRVGLAANDTIGTEWEMQDGELVSISAGADAGWEEEAPSDGVRLAQIAASVNSVWGISTEGAVFVRDGEPFQHPKNKGKWLWIEVSTSDHQVVSVSVCPNGNVWIVQSDFTVLVRQGISDQERAGTSWKVVPGALLSVSCGNTGLWGVDAQTSMALFRHGVSDSDAIGLRWEMIGPEVREVSTGPTMLAWAIDTNFGVWARTGVVPGSIPSGTNWVRVLDVQASHISAGALVIPPPASLAANSANSPLEGRLALSGRWADYGHGFRPAVVEQVASGACLLSGRIAAGEWSQFAKVQRACWPSHTLVFAVNNGDGTTIVSLGKKGELRYANGTTNFGWLSLDGIEYDPVLSPRAVPVTPSDGFWAAPEDTHRPAVSIRRSDGVCALSGMLRGGGQGEIGTVGEGCEPDHDRLFGIASSSGVSLLNVTAQGALVLSNFPAAPSPHSWVSLDGVSYVPSAMTPLRTGKQWTEQGAAATVERVGHLCHVGGTVSGDVISQSQIAVLPSYCRPDGALTFGRVTGEAKPVRIDVMPNGAVLVGSSKGLGRAWVHLDGIAFDPEASVAVGPNAPPPTAQAQAGEAQDQDDANANTNAAAANLEDPAPPTQTVFNARGLWRSFGSGYRGGVVELTEDGLCVASGMLQGGNRDVLGQLPSFCTPSDRLVFALLSDTGEVRVDVLADGTVEIVRDERGARPAWVSLAGITFYPAQPSDLPVADPWRPARTTTGGSGASGQGFRPIGLSKVNALCLLSGLVERDGGAHQQNTAASTGTGTGTGTSIIATLPLFCRPSKTRIFSVQSGGAVVQVQVKPTGKVVLVGRLVGATWVSLDGVRFDPAASSPLGLEGSWTGRMDALVAGPLVMKEGSVCVLGGTVEGGRWGAIAKLPEECRPRGKLAFGVNSNTTVSRVDVHDDGIVQLASAVPEDRWLSLDGIAFDPWVGDAVVASNRMSETLGQDADPTTVGDSSALFQAGHLVVPSTDVLDAEGDLTLEFWFKATNGSRAALAVHRKPGNGAASYGVVWQGTGKPLAYFDAEAHQGNRTGFALGNWYHVALVRDTTNRLLSLYVDGALDVTSPLVTEDACTTMWQERDGDAPRDKCLAGPVAGDEGEEGEGAGGGPAKCAFAEDAVLPAQQCFLDVEGVRTSDLHIGGAPAGSLGGGSMAEVRVWSVKRTAAELAEAMHARATTWTDGLTCNWQFGGPDSLRYDAMLRAPVARLSSPGAVVTFVRGGPGLRAADVGAGAPSTSSVSTRRGRVRMGHCQKIHFSNTEPVTLELWFNANDPAPSAPRWLALKNGEYGVQWQGVDKPLVFYDGSFHTGVRAKFHQGSWYHVAVVDSGGGGGTGDFAGVRGEHVALYIDGVLDRQVPREPRRIGSSPLHVGGLGTNYFDGAISDVRVWRVARSTQQLRTTMNRRLTGTEAGLAAYLKFQTAGTLLVDATDNGPLEARGAPEWLPEGPELDLPIPGSELNFELQRRGAVPSSSSSSSGDAEQAIAAAGGQGGDEQLADPLEVAGAAERTGLQFDGNSKVLLPRKATFVPAGASFSVTFFAKASTLAPELKGTVLSFFSSAQRAVTFAVSDLRSLQVTCGGSPGGRTEELATGIDVGDGALHAVAVVLDRDNAAAAAAGGGGGGAQVLVYVDGVRLFNETLDGPFSLLEGSGTIVLGQTQACDGGCFDPERGLKATLRHVALWSKALGEAEVRERVQSPGIPLGSAAGLVAWYPMDDGKGRRVADRSGNGLSGDMQPVEVVDRAAALMPQSPSGLVAHYEIDSTGSLRDRLGFSGLGDLVDVGQECSAGGALEQDKDWHTVLSFQEGTGFRLPGVGAVVGRAYTVAVRARLADTRGRRSLFRLQGATDGLIVVDGELRTTTEEGGGEVGPSEWHELVFVHGPAATNKAYLNGRFVAAFRLLDPTAVDVGPDSAMVFFSDGPASGGCSAGSAGSLKTIMLWDRALSGAEIAEGVLPPRPLEPVTEGPSGHWVKLLEGAEYNATTASQPSAPLQFGEFTKLRAVLVDGGLWCASRNASSSLAAGKGARSPNVTHTGWQLCHKGRSGPFELQKNGGEYVVEQASWGALPGQCRQLKGADGDIVCNATFSLAEGDTLSATWFEASHGGNARADPNQPLSRLAHGWVRVDVYGWALGVADIAHARVARYSVDTARTLANRALGQGRAEALRSVGDSCALPVQYVSDKHFRSVARFESGTGFAAALPADMDETRFSIAVLVKLDTAVASTVPAEEEEAGAAAAVVAGVAGGESAPVGAPLIMLPPAMAGLVLDGDQLMFVPSLERAGKLTTKEWHKLVVTHNIEATKVYVDGELVKELPSQDALVSRAGEVRLFTHAPVDMCDTSGVSGWLKEVQVFSRVLSAAEVANLMPNLPVPTESRKAYALRGDHFLKSTLLDFPERYVTACMQVLVGDAGEGEEGGAEGGELEAEEGGAAKGTLLSVSAPEAPGQIVLSLEEGTGAVELSMGDARVAKSRKRDLRDGEYHHVCASLNADIGEARVYVDAKEAAKGRFEAAKFAAESVLVVGQRQTCHGGCFASDEGLRARVHSVRVWRAVLGAPEVAADSVRRRRPTTTQIVEHATGVASDFSLFAVWPPEAVHDLYVSDISPGGHSMGLGTPGWVTECPADCSGHGVCAVGGRCVCEAGYQGDDCSEGCPNACSLQGTCVDNHCVCLPQFRGADCSIAKDPNEDVISDQCVAVPSGHPLFCSMITHPVPVTLSGARLAEADDKALETYKRLSKYCPTQAGRELLKHSVCGSYLLKCTETGEAQGICRSQCLAYERACFLPVSACNAAMFVDDASGDCYTSYPAGYPTAVLNTTCPRNCSDHGECVKGACACFEGYTGGDCSQYDGDRTQNARGLDFCHGIVDYSIPAAYNLKWSDTTAKKAYNLLAPFCHGNLKGLTAMHHTLCATAFFKVSEGKVLKPCRSMCTDYASQCGISSGLSCFSSDFYSDEPNCFKVDYLDRYLEAAGVTWTYGDPQQGAALVVPEDDSPKCPANFTCLNGACVDGKCSCLRGWFSRDCSVEIPTCPNYCSNHGVCQDQLCKCLPGWTGDDCSSPTDLCDFSCMEDGWRTESCCAGLSSLVGSETRQNEFVSPGCGKDQGCSGHGACAQFESFEACECFAGFTGWDCSITDRCLHNCSGHGVCKMTGEAEGEGVAPGTLRETYVNEDGEAVVEELREPLTGNRDGQPHPVPVPRHPNETSQYAEQVPVSLNLTYVPPDDPAARRRVRYGPPNWLSERASCECAAGYFGDDCSKSLANATMCPHGCSGHGACVVSGANPAARQIATSFLHLESALAPRAPRNATRRALLSFHCACDEGYSGHDCSKAKACPNDCHGRGRCDAGKCKCNGSYLGDDCSLVVAQCGKHFQCLNLGVCDHTRTRCNCLPFYEGKDCGKRISNPACPADFSCENGGRCFEGRCLCVPGTYGYDCNGSYATGMSEWETGSRLVALPKTPAQYRQLQKASPPPEL